MVYRLFTGNDARDKPTTEQIHSFIEAGGLHVATKCLSDTNLLEYAAQLLVNICIYDECLLLQAYESIHVQKNSQKVGSKIGVKPFYLPDFEHFYSNNITTDISGVSVSVSSHRDDYLELVDRLTSTSPKVQIHLVKVVTYVVKLPVSKSSALLSKLVENGLVYICMPLLQSQVPALRAAAVELLSSLLWSLRGYTTVTERVDTAGVSVITSTLLHLESDVLSTILVELESLELSHRMDLVRCYHPLSLLNFLALHSSAHPHLTIRAKLSNNSRTGEIEGHNSALSVFQWVSQLLSICLEKLRDNYSSTLVDHSHGASQDNTEVTINRTVLYCLQILYNLALRTSDFRGLMLVDDSLGYIETAVHIACFTTYLEIMEASMKFIALFSCYPSFSLLLTRLDNAQRLCEVALTACSLYLESIGAPSLCNTPTDAYGDVNSESIYAKYRLESTKLDAYFDVLTHLVYHQQVQYQYHLYFFSLNLQLEHTHYAQSPPRLSVEAFLIHDQNMQTLLHCYRGHSAIHGPIADLIHVLACSYSPAHICDLWNVLLSTQVLSFLVNQLSGGIDADKAAAILQMTGSLLGAAPVYRWEHVTLVGAAGAALGEVDNMYMNVMNKRNYSYHDRLQLLPGGHNSDPRIAGHSGPLITIRENVTRLSQSLTNGVHNLLTPFLRLKPEEPVICTTRALNMLIILNPTFTSVLVSTPEAFLSFIPLLSPTIDALSAVVVMDYIERVITVLAGSDVEGILTRLHDSIQFASIFLLSNNFILIIRALSVLCMCVDHSTLISSVCEAVLLTQFGTFMALWDFTATTEVAAALRHFKNPTCDSRIVIFRMLKLISKFTQDPHTAGILINKPRILSNLITLIDYGNTVFYTQKLDSIWSIIYNSGPLDSIDFKLLALHSVKYFAKQDICRSSMLIPSLLVSLVKTMCAAIFQHPTKTGKI